MALEEANVANVVPGGMTTPPASNAPAADGGAEQNDDFQTVVVDEIQDIRGTLAQKNAVITDLQRQVSRLSALLGDGDIGPTPSRQASRPGESVEYDDDGNEVAPPAARRNPSPPNEAVVAAQAQAIVDLYQSEFPVILASDENKQIALAVHNDLKSLGVITDSTDPIEAAKVVARGALRVIEAKAKQSEQNARLTKFRKSPDGAKPTGSGVVGEALGATTVPSNGRKDYVERFTS